MNANAAARLPGLLIAALVAAWLPAGAAAQAVAAGNADELKRLIDRAHAQGAQVVVIQAPPPAEAGAAAPGDRIEDRAIEVRARLRAVLADAPAFPERLGAAILGYSDDLSMEWLAWALLSPFAFLAVGAAAARAFRRWGRGQFPGASAAAPTSRAEKLARLLLDGVMEALGVAIMATAALLLVVAFDRGEDHVRMTQFLIVAQVAGVGVLAAFFRSLFAPHAPACRLLHIPDADAKALYRDVVAVLSLVALAGGTALWIDLLSLDANAHLLSTIAAALASALALGGFAIRHRRAVAGAILGAADARPGRRAARLLARVWHVLAVAYLLAAWAVTTVRLVLDRPAALELVTAPVVVLFGAIGVYGAAMLAIEWAFRCRRGEGGPEPAAVEAPPGLPLRTYKGLAERAAGLVVTGLAIWSVLVVWGVDLTADGGVLRSLWEMLLVGFLAWLAAAAVNVAVDRRIAAEGGFAVAERGDEGGAGGASRLATLLPLLRNFVLVAIAAIFAMIALSELGVDIAPLFAGAGVVGLAVGFGAQTLIRDVFSGAFFLVDDAFRVGEYIDIGTVKGTVEKISIRSMQLRHHKGPLHTVPFGGIAHLTNFSRDWVIMKLPLRLTYDTDVEKVRKLIKTLGQELLDHPVIGGAFLDPLKSQGVYQMEDSAMIVRVKFMTRPGEQFVVRKLVYQRIREMFEREGIKFAHREVTVRVTGDPEGQPVSEGAREAAAGAARAVIDPDRPAPAADGR